MDTLSPNMTSDHYSSELKDILVEYGKILKEQGLEAEATKAYEEIHGNKLYGGEPLHQWFKALRLTYWTIDLCSDQSTKKRILEEGLEKILD
ncbi:hypothetical protein HYS49_01480 [Candidatus Woesearchaeota archaeon]|nr:hypothetical protein [Candidatus Woesearchaeota archaeon]